MGKICLITLHEIVRHLRQRSFVIATLSIPVLSLLLLGGAQLLRNHVNAPDPEEMMVTVGILPDTSELEDGSVGIGYIDHAGIIGEVPAPFPEGQFRAFPDEASATAAIEEGEIIAYYVLAADYMESGDVTRIAPEVQSITPDSLLFARLIRTNLLAERDPALEERLDYLMDLEMVRLDPQGQPVVRPTPEHLKLRNDGEDADEEETERPSAVVAGELMTDSDAENVALQQQEEELYRVMVPMGVAMIMYMIIFSSSGLLLNSVIEEKENRTLEILLTSLLPRELLAGKVLGLGVLGLGQSLIWFGTGGLLLAMRNDTPDFFNFTLPLAIWVLLCIYCLSGYLIYASLMAGIGAVVSSTREASLFTGFLIIPFMVPLICYGIITEQPDSMIALGLSIFPLTAPVTMMMRLLLTHVTWWQITLSLLVMAGSVMVCIWLAARAFRISTLLTGKKLNPMTIWRALQG